MRFRTCATLALIVLIVVPGGLRAQGDAAVAARYDAAIAWINLVVAGEFEEAAAQANDAVADQMTTGVLEDGWGQLAPQLGDLGSLEPQDQGMLQGFHEVIMTGVFAAGTFDVRVIMADDHTVAGFFVTPPGSPFPPG
jgi:hypothetical protein